MSQYLTEGRRYMVEPERFYCMGCAKVLPVEQARIQFRTGFYRAGLPLGICSDCANLNFVKKAGLAAIHWYNKTDVQ